MENIEIRPIEGRDHALLPEFLYHAIFVPEGGWRRTSLSVQKDNPAVRFYQRLGYVVTGEREDGAGHEDHLMIRELC